MGHTETPPQVGRLDVHDHMCWVFTSDDQHQKVVTSFLGTGVARGERVMFLGSSPGRSKRITCYLGAAGLAVDDLFATGQLVVGTAEDMYLRNGRFDARARVHGYEATVRDALSAGFAGFRVAAEVAWLLGCPSARRDWPGYEFRADLLAARLPFAALCAYGRLWQDDELALLAALHNRSAREEPSGATAGFRLYGQRDGSIRLSGELDAAYGENVRRVLDAGDAHAGVPVLDVAELRFVDVAGIRAVAAACQAMAKVSGRATIRGASDTFKKVWHLTGYDRVAPAVTVE